MLRLGITGVPVWQLAATMAVLVASVLGGLWIAAKLLRIFLLMYGKRPASARSCERCRRGRAVESQTAAPSPSVKGEGWDGGDVPIEANAHASARSCAHCGRDRAVKARPELLPPL